MRPFVLSIAGFDPSSGAGITADIKTFENLEVYGLGVCSAITIQNDSEFTESNWTDYDVIYKQIDVLLKKYKVDYVKIGLIENLDILDKLITEILRRKPGMKIIWDPILKASSGFDFHDILSEDLLVNILINIYLITPNLQEYEKLFTGIDKNSDDLITMIAEADLCNVLLKGGHSGTAGSDDVLFEKTGRTVFKADRIAGIEKHGTGCVLSSAITALLAKKQDLKTACQDGKEYITEFIKSNQTALGYHNQYHYTEKDQA
ncbi:MAG: hydroxymethylpyrimidine/phosphomethylpyrimidine kinase [Chlorobi bacterium]|nr:hydroxymethylpyrimidine/phosphomethylpyrimidine kinase [Chlorobiota bacterium]